MKLLKLLWMFHAYHLRPFFNEPLYFSWNRSLNRLTTAVLSLLLPSTPGFLTPPPYATAFERRGLSCESRLPRGANPMAPPPLVAAADPVDPRKHPALQGWAQDVGRGILKIINNVKKL